MSKVHSELLVQLQRTQQSNLTISKWGEQCHCLLWQILICYPSEASQRRASRSRSHCKALQPNCEALLLGTAVALSHDSWHIVIRPLLFWLWHRSLIDMGTFTAFHPTDIMSPEDSDWGRCFWKPALFPLTSAFLSYRKSMQIKNMNKGWRLHYAPFHGT